MSEVAHYGLSDALTSDNPAIRIEGRCAASNWTKEFANWMQDKVDRGSAAPDIILAITNVMVATHSAALANFMKPAGFGTVADLIKAAVDARYISNAERCYREIVARKEAGLS